MPGDLPDPAVLRREARKLLQSVRSGASGALTRIRSVPRLHDLDEEDVIVRVRLVDAQHAIAAEHASPSWQHLLERVAAAHPVAGHVERFLEAVRASRPSAARRLVVATPAIARSSIHAACALGAADLVEEMLAARPEAAVEPHGRDGWAPLLYACASPFRSQGPQVAPGLLRCAELLLDRGADPNAAMQLPDADPPARIPALYFACVSGDAPLARLLLDRGAEPNDGESIYHAAEKDERACLELLVDHGASVDGTGTSWGNTPLYFLAGYPASHPSVGTIVRGMEWLLEHGADPDKTSMPIGETPLHRIASGALEPRAAELLLAHGADASRPRTDGTTPLALAVRAGNTALVELFRRNGADASSVTPADELLGACMRADAEAARARVAAHPAIVASLSEEQRMAPIHAAGAGNVEALRLMASLGFDLAAEGTWSGTPLHWAAWNGRAAAVAHLIEEGVPVDARDRQFGSSPLGWAAHGSSHARSADPEYVEVVDALLAAGAGRAASINRWNEPPERLASRKLAAHLRRIGFARKDERRLENDGGSS